MADQADQADQVDDDEILYRRVPLTQYDHGESRPSAEAFLPHRERDVDGLSFWRARLRTAEEVAVALTTGKHGNVAAIRAQVLRVDLGLTIRVDEDNPAHVLVPELNNRKDNRTREVAQRLADELTDIVLEQPPEQADG